MRTIEAERWGCGPPLLGTLQVGLGRGRRDEGIPEKMIEMNSGKTDLGLAKRS
jgi:hypothetical protein